MLLFELFPAFMAMVSLAVAIALYVANRRSRNDPPDPVVTATPPPPGSPAAQATTNRRPSMSA